MSTEMLEGFYFEMETTSFELNIILNLSHVCDIFDRYSPCESCNVNGQHIIVLCVWPFENRTQHENLQMRHSRARSLTLSLSDPFDLTSIDTSRNQNNLVGTLLVSSNELFCVIVDDFGRVIYSAFKPALTTLKTSFLSNTVSRIQ